MTSIEIGDVLLGEFFSKRRLAEGVEVVVEWERAVEKIDGIAVPDAKRK